ncbi:enoyl-CoA hydratase-related protein [Tardiphaga robiniae]|uniref:Enoyl-CoA hydratase n=1 Tax=Tardiphaga robiniae TaxID=943830 RepID=A0A161RN64_9BRAD|nr:enoyl-CoA hydratase-related protein [Tardiphaga robiniae]KZD24708.1 enoyl-CoA hydratase [Tardiphaga robiniae]
MSTPGDIVIDIADSIATLRLANPARRNAISTAMWNKIAAFAGDVATRKDIGVVVIRGEGDLMFSAGADISDFATARSGEGNARAYDDLVENTCLAIEAIPQPTIGLIYGGCMGAGSSVAASCDMRVAADDAFFAVPAAKLGLGYDPRGIARFIRVFGAGATRQVLFTTDRLPAMRAHALGAVHVIAPKADIESLAGELARKIAGNAPLTIKAAKAAIRALSTSNAELLAEAEQFYAAADASADYAEGRKAFAEKRPPRFTGS